MGASTTEGTGTGAAGCSERVINAQCQIDSLNGSSTELRTDVDSIREDFDDHIAQAGPGGGIDAIVEDLTPQLGGDLDTNQLKITTASN